jgi:thioester reductase-like protein
MSHNQPLAIIGMGCRFPGGVTDTDSYWQLLIRGDSGISEIPANRWNWKKYHHLNNEVPGRMVTKWGGFVDNHDHFDAQFFGISPREAQQMDIQQRWLLETSWQALEDAGLAPHALRGSRTSVFIGISSHDQFDIQRGDMSMIDIHSGTGTALSIAANRISYMFDFKGPSMAIDTACSSALVATYLACQSIWSGQCTLALAGGVNALLNPNVSIGFSKASMLSPDGQCFTFDSRANGYVRGEGVAVVVIKPLRQAEMDGDPIYAVIRSAATNQDGHTSSLAVPGMLAQEAMLREAYQNANIPPSHVVYVETHGTGTPVGDPIEARALGHVLGEGRLPNQPCLIGSVKTNIGHLEAASGMAGLIKAALILHHGVIPPHLNFEQTNPNIPMTELGLEVVTKTRKLSRPEDQLPVVGVNSFGFGGTNAHIVLEQIKQINLSNAEPTSVDRPYLLPLSAFNESALQTQAESYLTFLDNQTNSLADITASAGSRREHFDHRLVIIGRDADDLRSRLSDFLNNSVNQPCLITGQPAAQPSRPVFVFTGQGAQWWGMGRQLLEREPLFRQTVQIIDDLFQPLSGWSLLTEMTRLESDSLINRTDIAQPAIFSLQVALAELWAAWGIRPAKVIGHSVGEVSAAYVAGIYTLADAVKIIYHRSRLQNQTAGQGSMAAVGLSQTEALQAIAGCEDLVQVGAINSPRMVTLTGAAAQVEEITSKLESAGTFVRRLPINYAFHSYQMDSIREELLTALKDIQPQPSHIPFISTVTGEIMKGESMDAAYWWDNVRQPVRFFSALTDLIQSRDTTFLELGPHPALQNSIHDCLTEQNHAGYVFHSLRRDTDESLELLSNLAELHVYGLPINWSVVNQSNGRYVRLPGYPWQRKKYWLDSELHRRNDLESLAHPLLGMRLPAPQPTWEHQIDPRVLDYLNDHKIWDSIVFPAAGYGEMGLAVARILFPDETYAVESLQIKKALFVTIDHLPIVQTVFDEAEKTFSIYSATDEKKEWQLHARGQIRKLSPVDIPPANLPDIKKRLAFLADKERYYQAYHDMGYQFGPDFQQIQSVWSAHGVALAEVIVSDAISQQAAENHFHPALLDACFQSVSAAAAIIGITQTDGEVFYLPAAFGRIQLLTEPLPDKFWVYASITAQNTQSITADFQVYDEHGILLAIILAGRFDRVQKNSSASKTLGVEFYQFQWEAKSLDSVPIAETKPAPVTYLLLADQQGVSLGLGKTLRRTGARVITATVGEKFEASAPPHYVINPADESEISRLLSTIHDDHAPLTAIVHAWGLDNPSSNRLSVDQLATTQATGVLFALHLTHALSAGKFTKPPSVVFLTRDMYPALESDTCSGLVNAPLVGFLRVANNESSSFNWRMIDLDPAQPEGEIEHLFQELTQHNDELEVAYRKEQRYINRLRQIKLDALPPLQSNAIQPDGETLPFRLQINQPGQLSNLSLNEITRKIPEPEEIEVWVQSGGLNFRDVLKALGLYPGNPDDLLWLGDDFAGLVSAVGKQVTNLKQGDRVAGMAPYAFQSHLTVDRRAVFKIPAQLSFEEAATLPTVFLTAYYAMVQLARLQPGESILIHAATGGVGQAALQIAQDLGLEIYATAGTPEKRAFLKEQGVPHVFDSRSLNFADEIMRVTDGRGVDTVLNSLAGDFIPKNFSVLAPFGRYLEIGKIDVYSNSKIGLEALRNNISVFIIDLSQLMECRPTDFVDMIETLRRKFEQNIYRPLPYTVFPINKAAEAFRYMAAGKHIGKNVLSFQADEVSIGRPTDDGSLFRPRASYLITGGAGGFGLEVAKWMVRQGARYLALMTRSGPPDEAAKIAIEQLRSAGVTVLDMRGDVTRAADVERVIRDLQDSPAPLAGVIHSAMVLNDKLLADLDDAGFIQAFYPKILGAWNLHQATLKIPLEHFICFSSISSVIGNAKQANYSAGNAFLDMLAYYRRARGLPALTLNWGALTGAGFLSRSQETSSYLQSVGIKSISTTKALEILDRLLPLEGKQIGIASVNWDQLSRYLTSVNTSTFKDLLRHKDSAQADTTINAQIIAAHPSKRLTLVENFLIRNAANVLGTDESQIDLKVPLTQMGLDSLMSIELSLSLQKQFNVSLAVSDVLSRSTLQDVALIILKKIMAAAESESDHLEEDQTSNWAELLDQAETQVDLPAESQLDANIRAVETNLPPVTSARSVLLTGATGFLGAFLLSDLLGQTSADVYCLVRAETIETGLQRLQDNLSNYGLWDDEFRHRIHPIPGDLAQPLLGLADDQFERLAAEVDVIYHNGAALNLLLPYTALKAVNTLSVREILRLAFRTKIKPVHYISTIAVFYAAGQSRHNVIRESDWPEPQNLRGGYMQSKWVAEQFIRQAQERGLPCSIYRPGLISGHSQTGVTNHQDLTSRLVKGCVQLGTYPDGNREFNIVPVDYVSRAIVYLSRQPDTPGQTFHLTNPQPAQLNDVVNWTGSIGFALQEASYQTWRAALIDQFQRGLKNDLLPILPFFSSDRPEQMEQQVDCHNTLERLAGSGIACPPIDADLIKIYVDYMFHSGFLEAFPVPTGASRLA